jgi:hypothetical protein
VLVREVFVAILVGVAASGCANAEQRASQAALDRVEVAVPAEDVASGFEKCCEAYRDVVIEGDARDVRGVVSVPPEYELVSEGDREDLGFVWRRRLGYRGPEAGGRDTDCLLDVLELEDPDGYGHDLPDGVLTGERTVIRLLSACGY